MSKAYGRAIALNDLNLSVPWGRALTIIGPNGSGKTTLIKILATLSKPDAGTISIAGLDARRDGALARRLIGVMTHDPLLYDDLTARENLLFAARMFGLEDTKRTHRDSIQPTGYRAPPRPARRYPIARMEEAVLPRARAPP